MSNRKYAVNTNGLKKKYSTKEIVEMAVALNLDGIEWGLSGLEGISEEIKEMATRTTDAGLEVVGYINGGKLWKSGELREWGDVVTSVGGKTLRVSHPWIAYNLDESLHQKDSFNEIFFALNCGGFEGYISMEEFFTDGDDQHERLGEAMAFLKECDKNAPSQPEPPFTNFND